MNPEREMSDRLWKRIQDAKEMNWRGHAPQVIVLTLDEAEDIRMMLRRFAAFLNAPVPDSNTTKEGE